MSNSGLQQVFFDAITANDASASAELGTERWKDGNKYRYIQNGSSDTTCVANQVVKWENAGDFTVTPVTVISAPFAGITATAIDPQKYGWLTVSGFEDATTTGSVAINDRLRCAGTTGVLRDSTVAGEFMGAYAIEDATSNVAKVYLSL